MRLIRHGEKGYEEPGVLLPNGRVVDASGEFHDYDEGFFAMGGLESLGEWVKARCPGGEEVDPGVRLGPPVARPSKIVCVGKNYLDHANEFGEGVPEEPTLFMKATSAWSGPLDEVVIPRGGTKMDYEVELALVIGRTVSGVSEAGLRTAVQPVAIAGPSLRVAIAAGKFHGVASNDGPTGWRMTSSQFDPDGARR